MENFVIEIKDKETEDLDKALGVDEDTLADRTALIAGIYEDDAAIMIEGKCKHAELVHSVSLGCNTKEELAYICFCMGQVAAEAEIEKKANLSQ